MDTTTKKQSRKNSTNSFEEIKKNSNEELVDLIDNVLNNIKNVSVKREWFEAYYDTVKKAIGLEDCVRFVNNKKNNTSNFTDIEKPKPHFNDTKLKSKIMDNDTLRKDTFGAPTKAYAQEITQNNPNKNNIISRMANNNQPEDEEELRDDDDEFNVQSQ